jgi:xanthine dehydrogenase accessory factor
MQGSLELIWEEAARLQAARQPYVLIQVLGGRGSVPADIGSRLLFQPGRPLLGTVGGGRIEAAALRRAAELLAGATPDAVRLEEKTWNLQRDIGMTCGGEVHLLWEVHNARPWTVAIFGAGHVVQALMPVLLPLPVTLYCSDERAEWIARLPQTPNLHAGVREEPASLVAELPSGAFILSITQGHRTDVPVLLQALGRDDFPFVGCIGSKAKAATLRAELRGLGVAEEALQRLVCPVGLPLGSNHPQEIAISIAAQLLQERDSNKNAL